ncbi:DUF1353 domain-containing protein, partial [Patescibacteria group bacterium]|nr:DUF1353 domain-containing protein [Patescibacteria group bacterium]
MVLLELHDAIYSSELFTRSECDRIFYEIMVDWGTPLYSAYAKWLAVRTFGWWVWQSHDQLS